MRARTIFLLILVWSQSWQWIVLSPFYTVMLRSVAFQSDKRLHWLSQGF